MPPFAVFIPRIWSGLVSQTGFWWRLRKDIASISPPIEFPAMFGVVEAMVSGVAFTQ